MMLGAVVFAVALQQAPPAASNLQREAPVLLQQAAASLYDARELLSFSLGKCSRVMPTGRSLPSVSGAAEEVAALGIPDLNDGLIRREAIGYAEGLQAAASPNLTVRGCADEIDERAAEEFQAARGLMALLQALEGDARR